MSLVDSLGWPTLNSTHSTPLDLHLLCSLAANRAGYSGMDLSSTPRAGNIRCSVVRPAEPERDLPRRTCKEILVGFKVLGDAEGVRVSEVNKGKLGAESHRAHREVAVPLVSG